MKLNLNALEITQMANSHLCLSLTSNVTWESFAEFAERFLSYCNGQIIEKAESPDMKLWIINISGSKMQLVFDDYPVMISLESLDLEGDRIIKEVYSKLSV